jgi:hypothetical protein
MNGTDGGDYSLENSPLVRRSPIGNGLKIGNGMKIVPARLSAEIAPLFMKSCDGYLLRAA